MTKGWLHDAIFQEKEEQDQTEEVKSSVLPTVQTYNPASAYPPIHSELSAVSSGVDDSQMYEKLKQNTAIEQLPSLQKIFSLAKTLEGFIPDPVTRIKAAFTQAAAQGLTSADVTKDLTTLDKLVTQEKAKFDSRIQQETASVTSDEQQAGKLEQQLHDLRTSISDHKNKLDRAQIAFSTAFGRRQGEVNQLKAQLANL